MTAEATNPLPHITFKTIMQSPSQPPQTAIAPNPSVSVNQTNANTGLAGALIVTIPLVLIAAVMLYRRYRVVARRQQIATLERIWKLTTRERTS